VDASPITIGAVDGNPNVGNTFPFGGPAGGASIRVTAVEFFAAPGIGSRQVASATYTFSMSTTTRAVDALDTVNLSSNIGWVSKPRSAVRLGTVRSSIRVFAVPSPIHTRSHQAPATFC
jgi:hypothetical protein